MVRLSHERVLLIGDKDRQMYDAVMHAAPAAHVKSVATVFDAIAELTHEQYTTIFAAVEPIERRPESAVRTLRDASGEGRLLLFGHPTLEPLSQKMLEFGCDDYLVTPAAPGELLHILGSRRTQPRAAAADTPESYVDQRATPFAHLALSEMALDAIANFPADPISVVVKQINDLLPAGLSLLVARADAPAPPSDEGTIVISRTMPAPGARIGALHLTIPENNDRESAEAFLADAEPIFAKLELLQDRHCGLQRLAITDELTGVFNGRYLRHFLAKIIEKAHVMRFPVTLFLFDIDNFKRYNDQYGHGVGDEILKQTAALMRRCCRDHDLVARISGDEFAVVFWEKEGPRQPRDPRALPPARTPQEPHFILDRFRRLLSSQDFPGLGPTGKGILTISGGLAVYPYDGNDVESLMTAADKELMFGAKRSGRNSIQLVGGGQLPLGDAPPEKP